ncbi:MAG: pilus assembly protein PilP [Azoarcus sp.]|uniref:Pilus assembly protein PilP n=2 Tax=Parazoarcus communis TaxID=41977 RepID=A0A2U8GQJ5_9RHOO|nr:pilus assembly protein PilP [Parazoarcus communis]PKO58238.1 MAG: pilus assembly protein PilP [Betaproteobacteria bacterium HGW-Betaproteobacteria-19]PLX69108.1 MAG: pilus assembly protein PilP [Azoarcus sp.]TVT51899.1 MAG: pilus assembly protein PilP [Azoarcus sp. PHD]
MMRKFLLLISCIALTGCADDQEDIQSWMAEQSAGMRGVVKPLPEIKVFSVVDYAGAALIEPFKASRIEPERKNGGGGLRPDPDRRREPLEAYPLESLRMVGILTQDNVSQALIQADKSLYRVKAGNYLGQDYGVITAVTDSSVELRELVEDVNGDWVERASSLQLQERQEAGK